MIRGEHVDDTYTTAFIKALFEREGGDLFDVRGSVLGHVQQGGDPTPFDRIQATRLASNSVKPLIDQALADSHESAFVGLHHGKVTFTPLSQLPELIEPDVRRPRQQGWLSLRPLAKVMASQGPTQQT